MRRALTSVVALAIAALLAGCGGGNGGASGPAYTSPSGTSTVPTATTATTVPAETTTIPSAGTSPSWRPLSKAPIPGRIAQSAVWTGSEMIVWGGVGGGGERSDGAAYNPATRKWRRIAPSPSGVRGGGGLRSVAAWTGSEMVVWAGNSPDGPAGGAAYNPRTDTWRRLPKGPLGIREGYAPVWTGTEMLIVGGNRGDTIARPTAAAVNPRTGSWRRLRALDAITATPNGAVWNGREAFICCVRTEPAGQPVLIAYNPTTDALRQISLAAAPTLDLTPIAWTGTEVVFSTSSDPLFSSTGVVRYNTTTGRWRTAKAAPCAPPPRDLPSQGGSPKRYTQIAWIGDRLVAACGTNGLQIYSPRTDTWRPIKPGPSPLNNRGGSAIVWTGTDLIAWSGAVRKLGGGPPPPADGASITLKQ
jgi:hypothetical protein